MQRRTFRIIGSEGHFDVEIQRIDGGALEVAQTDNTGRQVPPITIVHTWDEARKRAARLLSAAVEESTV